MTAALSTEQAGTSLPLMSTACGASSTLVAQRASSGASPGASLREWGMSSRGVRGQLVKRYRTTDTPIDKIQQLNTLQIDQADYEPRAPPRGEVSEDRLIHPQRPHVWVRTRSSTSSDRGAKPRASQCASQRHARC